MNTTEFLSELRDILMADAPLTPQTELNRLPGWDSMGLVAVLSLIDESLGATLPRGALRKCATVGDILALVNSHLTQ